jgi:hypothetical protein
MTLDSITIIILIIVINNIIILITIIVAAVVSSNTLCISASSQTMSVEVDAEWRSMGLVLKLASVSVSSADSLPSMVISLLWGVSRPIAVEVAFDFTVITDRNTIELDRAKPKTSTGLLVVF